ncbi:MULTISPECIES: Crp/Fnr family transcriptional regulator [Sphingobacterium]|jgi:CRP-like cAMP-binding protein|uniref:Cyclic nucleotide-binding domain n=1 Tax=Sphingobacterium multivorum TaxID=28454 RepID=A0A2X2J9P8_SPHMU|nr:MULTISPECIES: Crp/Fnr family transcriptional regulator [Sphingobacterium]HAE65890.1 Crp/Fnr family transcriptional regulator [Sphingobacterium sp.]MDF2852351.1 protein containing cyclic nucleotide-binding domain [Sphingobacterium multivorum]QQT44479.1 Crp/Fnr family transcriptional regulator [Sphingobacterium multivorum]QQT62779.1 Crp/Fnr family transcriptional regulator [Sphingobacterium multivorum]QRQ62052.1 Crp/Fnr family transcriptional regulator [Sphingobacterium multivorum]
MEQLLEYIRKFGQLDLREENLIRQAFEKKNISKSSYFVACGKVNNSIAFVESGVFRSLYYNSKGDDFTRYFIYEGRFIGDLQSFLDRTPSNDYIESLTDSEIWSLDFENFTLLEKEIKVWPLLMAKLYAFVVESKLKTANTMMNLDAKERYLLFLKLYPGLANRVPLAMLASYLGITASSLSRIRKNI